MPNCRRDDALILAAGKAAGQGIVKKKMVGWKNERDREADFIPWL